MFEEVAPKRKNAFRVVFLILLCGFILLSLPNWLSGLFALPYLKAVYEFLVFLGIALLIFRFLRFYGTEYKYSLADSVLVIRSRVGSRETVLAEIPLTGETRLVSFSQAAEVLRENRTLPRPVFYGVSDKKRAYLLTFPLQAGVYGVIFQPSDKFVEILQQLLLDKSEKI
ncbi:MAG: hypothetical protein J6B54_03635 [Clostridia bacterium]|nr:hypothetical protein [Clostridia bacterium]